MTFNGKMTDMQPSGKGIMKKGEMVLKGEFTDGKVNGPGEVTYKDENGKNVKYIGYFKDGKKDG